MRHQSRRRSYTRCRLMGGYLPALERINTELEKAFPELESARINRAMILLFGERPEITDFSDPPPDRPDLAP